MKTLKQITFIAFAFTLFTYIMFAYANEHYNIIKWSLLSKQSFSVVVTLSIIIETVYILKHDTRDSDKNTDH